MAKFTPRFDRLEERAVPATFYVDPNAVNNAGNGTFNPGRANAHTGPFNPAAPVDGAVYTDLVAAIGAANTNPGADTIRLNYGGSTALGGVIAIAGNAAPGTNPPVNITGSVSFIGEGAGSSILVPIGPQPTGIFQVTGAGTTVNWSNLSIYGSGQGLDSSGNVIGGDPAQIGIQYLAGTAGTIDGVVFQGLYGTAPNTFDGRGVDATGAGTVITVRNSRFSDIGAVGVRVATGATASLFDNVYLGKGAGGFFDYFAQVLGGTATISGNRVSGNLGVAPGVGNDSGALLVANNGTATIYGNDFGNNVTAVFVGNSATDTSTAIIQYNNLGGNLFAVRNQRAAGLPNIDATHNFWGDPSGPHNPTSNPTGLGSDVADGVNYRPFQTVPVPVESFPTLQQYIDANFPPPPPPPPPAIPGLVGYPQFAAGIGDGGGRAVNLYNPDGTLRSNMDGFPGTYTAGVRTAAADFNGDGIADVVVGTGPGAPNQVRVLDGATGQQLFTVVPFEASFTGGVFVAAGDITGDGVPDIAVTPDQGGGGRVVVFDGKTFSPIASFLGIDDPTFFGGARPAIGDINGDGKADLVVAAGFGGGPRVATFDGKTVGPGLTPTKLFGDFFVFEQALRNGAFVAVGDIDGDGKADLVAGGGPGGGPRVVAYSAVGLLAGQGAASPLLVNFFAGDVNNRGGIRVAVKNLDNDLKADLVAGVGTDGGNRVTGYLGKNFAGSSAPSAFTIDPFGGFTGGVFVG